MQEPGFVILGLPLSETAPFLRFRPQQVCFCSLNNPCGKAPNCPHVGATSGFLVLGGYALGWAAKAAQITDTGATAW